MNERDPSFTVMPEPPIDNATFLEWLKVPQPGDIDTLLKSLRPDRDGFTAADVEKVEATWNIVDMNYAEGAYILRLRDGRRFHLTWFVDDLPPEHRPDGASEGRQEGARTELLAAGTHYPDSMPEDVWSTDVEYLNEYLRQLQLPY
jgi:hypothetical protein